ncbi:hypothetical protein BJX62DRAFT_241237 [Aspergillus germanicus]
MASRLENAAYTVGWLCADHINLATARAMLEEEHGSPQTRAHLDDNSYVLDDLEFPKIRFGVLVGTGGGIPSDDNDIRLGDVAVSIPDRTFAGVVQFDSGKATATGFVRTGALNKPPRILLNAIEQVRANHVMGKIQVSENLDELRGRFDAMADTYSYQGKAYDRLFPADYPHQGKSNDLCTKCKGVKRRLARKSTVPVVHYGTIASSNQIIADGQERDRLAEEFGAICVETEAAGLMDNFPCVVIRGICNYADSHRKGVERWKQYASATAAAFAKELLQMVYAHEVMNVPFAADIMSEISVLQTGMASLKLNAYVHNLPTIPGAAYDSHSNDLVSRCYPGTRTELLREIQDWARDINGTEKSTISRTLAHTFHGLGQLAGSFFFKRGEAGRDNAKGLFTTIAAQMASHFPEAGGYIQSAVESNPSIADKVPAEQFNALILEPVLQAYKHMPLHIPKIVVLDALDECNSRDMEAILQIFRDPELPDAALRLFITSRPDVPILRGFKDLSEGTYRDIALQNTPEETTKHDLRLYLTHELRKIRNSHEDLPMNWPGKKTISILVDMAVPLFIFAATTCRFLSTMRHHPRDRLATVLKHQFASQNLHKTYLPVLEQLLDEDEDEDDEKDLIVSRFYTIVGAVILLFDPMSASCLARLLNLPLDVVNIQLDFLHSVLQISRDDSPIRLLHLSFRDFLTDKKTRSVTAFWIDKKKRHLALAGQCLERMSGRKGLAQDICHLKSVGVLRKEINPAKVAHYIPADLRYACIYWVDHLVKGSISICDKDRAYQFLKRHFLHWIEALSLLGNLDKAVSYIQALLAQVASTKEGKEVSRFLHDARRFLLYNLSTIEAAPLQLYSFALVFSPKNSIIRKTFKKCVPNWITRSPNVPENWSSLEQSFHSTQGYPKTLAFSPDGTKIACEKVVWNIAAGQQIRTPDFGDLKAVGFLSNDEVLLKSKGEIDILNLATGKILHSNIQLPDREKHFEAVVQAECRLVVVALLELGGGPHGQIHVYNADTGTTLLKKNSDLPHILSTTFISSDGRRIALVGRLNFSGRLEVWSLERAQSKIFSKIYKRPLGNADFSPNGTHIAFALEQCIDEEGDHEGRLLVVDVDADNVVKTLDNVGHVSCLAFSPCGNVLAFGSRDDIYLWNLVTSQMKTILEHVGCRRITFSPKDSNLL